MDVERKWLEHLLHRRKNKLIDLGLAQFGYAPRTLRTVFLRGNSGVRSAVLTNPNLFSKYSISPVIDFDNAIIKLKGHELQKLASNQYLPDEFYISLINRSCYFANLKERDYMFMLQVLGRNPRMSTPYNYIYLDGLEEYNYEKVFTAAWQLTATAPVTETWAITLAGLLYKAEPPSPGLDIASLIDRWSPAPTEPNEPYRNYYFLRTRLADLLNANEQLLNSNDIALRCSFYRRFSPAEFPDWHTFIARDGETFVQEAVLNLKLWDTPKEREKLSRVAWDCPDPSSLMSMPNLFRAVEREHKEQHPNWFVDDQGQMVENMMQKIESMLIGIENSLRELSSFSTSLRDGS